MTKKPFFIIIIFSFLFFSACVFLSSPYRELRPYILWGKNLPEQLGQITKINNDRITVLIKGNEYIQPFYIDQIPVTIKDYKRCLKSGKCTFQHYRYNYTNFYLKKYYEIFPVTFVNWFDAKTYCNAYGGDLPTNYQWSLSAGLDYGFDYPWGSSLPNLSNANLDGFYQMLTPAGWLPKGASPYGVLDMTGNVREWVLDEIYEDNDNKLLKGGGDNDSFSDGKIDTYFDHGPTSSGFNRGFRCVYPADAVYTDEKIQIDR